MAKKQKVLKVKEMDDHLVTFAPQNRMRYHELEVRKSTIPLSYPFFVLSSSENV